MLTVFHRKLGVPAENLHCIEVNDLVPKERRADFKLHILKDPVANQPKKGSIARAIQSIYVYIYIYIYIYVTPDLIP